MNQDFGIGNLVLYNIMSVMIQYSHDFQYVRLLLPWRYPITSLVCRRC